MIVVKSINKLVEEAEIVFQNKFISKPDIRAFAPGRVNIIGEHTDYNEGYVFPMALPMGTVVIGSKNNLNECHIYSMSNEIENNNWVSFSIPQGDEIQKSSVKWSNYVIGVVAYFKCNSKECFNAVINSSIPLGSGLSSSASLEVAIYTFLEGIYQVTEKMSLSDKALLCQKVEHDYADVPCGIMDQFIGVMGEKNHALFIDCRDLSSKLIKMGHSNVSILIINSNVKHDLGSSEYPLRRQQCFIASQILNKKSLRDVSLDELEDSKNKFLPLVYIRARHVVTENQRVLDAIEALDSLNYVKFGTLMNESHISLRDDFEVSCKELDQLVEIVQSCNGTLGSRMTGGGFGGCTVSLVYTSEIQNVIDEVKIRYSGKPVFYECTASDGAHLLHSE